MSDIYHRDTKKALEKFDEMFDSLKLMLADDMKDAYDCMLNEVDGLLCQYASNYEDLNSAKEALEENGIEL